MASSFRNLSSPPSAPRLPEPALRTHHPAAASSSPPPSRPLSPPSPTRIRNADPVQLRENPRKRHRRLHLQTSHWPTIEAHDHLRWVLLATRRPTPREQPAGAPSLAPAVTVDSEMAYWNDQGV